MQGQRGTIGSLTDTINFEFDTQTTNVDMDQQLCWNDLRNPSENTFMGNLNQEGQTLSSSRWNTVGSSSSNPQNLVGQIGWSPPINNTSIGVNFVSQPGVNLNLSTNNDNNDGGPTFVRGSTSGSASQNFDLNEGHFHRTVEDGEGRPLDGRWASCKRKTLEGDVGQSSSGGNGGNLFSRAEGSMWGAIPPPLHSSSNMTMTLSETQTPDIDISFNSGNGLPEEVNPRLGLGIGGGGRDIFGGSERSHRNYRLRMSSSSSSSSPSHPDSMPNRSFSPVPTVTRHSDVPRVHQPLRFVPMNPPIDLMSTPISSEPPVPPQNQSANFGLPSVQRSLQSQRWNLFRSGTSSSSSGAMFGEGDDALPEDPSSRSFQFPRNIGEHPVFTPPIDRSLVSRGSGSSSSSRSRSSARSQLPGEPTQYPRRLSEYVRRSLLPTGFPEVTGQSSSSQHQHRSVADPSQDGVLSSGGGTGNQGLSQSHSRSRSALWLERQGDGGAGGIPYLRALAAAGEGRSRIVSEIRNALNSIRRGEGLRIEDLMLLDQSIYFGRAELHDQHRDMRLDVDNMSYEELLALEERIGNVCTGLTEEMIVKYLKERKHVHILIDEDQTEAEPCCVCQEVYKEGEDIGTLDCGHDFHRDCIKQWLSQKNLCPICKTTGLATK